MGQLTTQDIGTVAHQTMEAAIRGQAIVVPGFLNQVARGLGGLVPAVNLADLIGARWRAAQQKRELTASAGL